MRRLKRLAVCLCAAMMGVATVIMPVSAKDSGDFNDVRPSYTDPFVGEKKYKTMDQVYTYYDICKVEYPANWYMDTYIQKEAQKYIDTKEYNVYDLRSLTGFGVNFQLSDYDHAFNYGFIACKNLDDNKQITVCKCTPSEFELVKIRSKSIWGSVSREEGNNFIIEYDGSKTEYKFNPDTLVLKATTYFR